MIKIDADFLASVGLADLPPSLHSSMLKHINSVLEHIVGEELMSAMSRSQLAEFDVLRARNDDKAELKWLASARPDYKDVVNRNMESLKEAIRSVAEQILLDEGIVPSCSTQSPAGMAATVDNNAVRKWAAEKGFQVSRFGRIPRNVIEAYSRRKNDGMPVSGSHADSSCQIQPEGGSTSPV